MACRVNSKSIVLIKAKGWPSKKDTEHHGTTVAIDRFQLSCHALLNYNLIISLLKLLSLAASLLFARF